VATGQFPQGLLLWHHPPETRRQPQLSEKKEGAVRRQGAAPHGESREGEGAEKHRGTDAAQAELVGPTRAPPTSHSQAQLGRGSKPANPRKLPHLLTSAPVCQHPWRGPAAEGAARPILGPTSVARCCCCCRRRGCTVSGPEADVARPEEATVGISRTRSREKVEAKASWSWASHQGIGTEQFSFGRVKEEEGCSPGHRAPCQGGHWCKGQDSRAGAGEGVKESERAAALPARSAK